MGKVKDEEKFGKEVVNGKRKKRKKELDLLRRNVLETKRKLRRKTAPPKTHVSTFNKVLNSFADRRQGNDNETQGFDSKGRRAGLKKMCNRLLPSRKPQIGIFANGSKGDEINRVNFSLNESDRARLEGDLQKVLNDGKRRCGESRFDALNTILHRPLPGTMDTEEQRSFRIPNEKLERNPAQNLVAERQCGKRKLEVPIELDGKIAKKQHSQVEKAKFVLQDAKLRGSEGSNSTDKKWKRSLFVDEECDFVPISEPAGIEELRFSPTIGKAKAEAKPRKAKASLNPSPGKSEFKKLNFKYGQLGRMAATRYEQLCGKVCAENFETCLQEIPHVDPLTKVKQSLLGVYIDTCNLKSARDKARFNEDSSTSGPHRIRSNIKKSNNFCEDTRPQRPPSDAVKVLLSPQGVGPGPVNPKNFLHWNATEILPAGSTPPMAKAPEIKRRKIIKSVNRGPSFSEKGITDRDTRSLDVNYDSSRQSLRSDIREFLKVDEEGGSPDGLSQKLAGISSDRKNVMWRYLKEANNREPLKEDWSIFSPHGSAASAENDNVQKCYVPEPLKRREMQSKKNRHAPERKLDEMRDPHLSKDVFAESAANPTDVKDDNVKPCPGLGLREFPKINQKGGPTVVNLGSASNSTLSRIPTNRKEIMQRYLKDVNDPEPWKDDGTKFPLQAFVDVAKDDKMKKRYLGDPLRRHQMKNTALADRPSKNERHVPSILRKSHASKRNKTSNTAGTVFARGVLEIGNFRLKSSNFNFEELSSKSDSTVANDLFNEKGRSCKKQMATTGSPFSGGFTHSTNPDHLVDLMIDGSPNTRFTARAAPLGPSIGVNALYDPHGNGTNERRNFMDLGFTPEVSTGRSPSGNLNFSNEFSQLPTNHRQQYSGDNVGLMDFHNARQPLNLPVFCHRQRLDTKSHRVACNDKHLSTGDQDSQRFPVFLSCNNASEPAQTLERQRGYPFPDKTEPKVIILQNPSLRGIGEDVRRGMNVPDLPFQNDGQNLQRNGTGFAFATIPQGMPMASTRTVQLRNCGQFYAPDATYQNVGQRGDRLQIRQCICKNDLQNVQRVQLPINVFQNEGRNAANHKHPESELRTDPMSLLQPTTFESQTSQRMFRHGAKSNGQISGPHGTVYGAVNTSAEIQHNCSTSAEPAQFFDKRVGFVLPKNDSDPFCQTAINLPTNSDQMLHREKYHPVLSEDINRNSKYIIDPRCPQAGYKWNQIDQSGAQVHQRVMQPVYNVTDQYRPQIPRNYYSADS